MDFKHYNTYQPTGDQPEAIRQLTKGVEEGEPHQTLLVVTDLEKLSPWQTLLRNTIGQHWFLATIRHWQLSFMVSSNSSFQKMRLSILYPITITISRSVYTIFQSLYRKRSFDQ
jgi:hypothetical protein